jgi:Ran GTPase-activating protein (RanGAP) involved in mRNA processing and transport
MSDNEDDYHSENDDDGCDCDECFARRGDGEDDYEDDDDDDDDDDHDDLYDTPASAVPRLCAQLRNNDPSIFVDGQNQVFQPDVPDSYRLEIAEALLQNTVVRRIGLKLKHYNKLSADAMAKYLAQSKRLLYVELSHVKFRSVGMDGPHRQFLPSFFEAIGQSNSMKEFKLTCPYLGPDCKSFENLLTRTKTLRYLQVDLKGRGPKDEAETAAIASGFCKNTTLREIVLVYWQETSLIPVLTALRDHPVLEKLHVVGFSSFTGMDALLRGKKCQLKELIIEDYDGFNEEEEEEMVGFESFMLEMGPNTTILKMAITGVSLSHDNIQHLKAMLHRNTVLQYLDLTDDALGSAGFATIASALYRNTFIQRLDVSDNGLDDLAAANTLRELLRWNKTITTLNIGSNTFGSNVAAVSCIAHGFSDNTTLQDLNLSSCELDDEGISILAESLGQQKRGLLNLNLSANQITCSGLRALVENATAALSTVTRLNLGETSVRDEGASFLAETLRLQTLPSLTRLHLDDCDISDDGLVALMSSLEENETLEFLDLQRNTFSVQGYMALASSLPNIKGLREIDFLWTTSDPTVMSAMLEGFRNNTSLHDLDISGGEHSKDWLQQVDFFLDRNKFSRLLQDSDTDDRASLGLWSRALGSVATQPSVLFYVLTSKAGLIRATPREDSNKRKRDASE